MTKLDHDKAETAITAIDLLLDLLMVCLVFAAIAMVRMNKPDAVQAVDMEVELNIEMTWPDGNFEDLDFWLNMLSDGGVSFDNKHLGFVTLDSDDDGTKVTLGPQHFRSPLSTWLRGPSLWTDISVGSMC